ncbi:MAG: lipoprotein-releasing ABC transporter permease subunit [candidate division Zixibacteria bacterium]|nr:lipoprotein-releasing ABC transporter permease subunit [candidate division Zixibacteria bacterium]
MSYEFFIAKRYLRSKRTTKFVSVITLISVGGVLIGVTALDFILSMMNGFEGEVRSRIIGTTAHVSVFSTYQEGVDNYQELIPGIKEVKHVENVAPYIYYKAAIASKTGSDGIVVRGIDPEKERLVTDLERNLKVGSLHLEQEEDELPGILLGATLADRLGVELGDKVVLFSLKEGSLTTGWSQPKASKLKLMGIFETGMYEYDASLAYISLPTAQKLFNLGSKVTGLHVKLDNLYQAEKVAKELEKKLGYHYYALDWMHMHKNLFSWMALEKYAMFIVLSLIVAVAAFNIISTLIMVVIEKRKDVGILKSMGSTNSSIMKIFMFEGLVVGAVGIILGSAFGYLLCWIQKSFNIISLPPEIYFISSLPVDMRPLDFILVASAAMLLTFLATVYPARRAAQLSPVEAIRYE